MSTNEHLHPLEAPAYCAILCTLCALLFVFGAPAGGAFSWPDSPRHALNGAFVMDLVRAAPMSDLKGYAYNYYSQYPALTILFYPPLFYVLLAPFYAVLGVSQETALFVIFLCYALFAWGTFFFARLWLAPVLSLAVALVLVTAPEVTYWGRQVMLEIPAFAFLVWSAYFFVRHIREERIGWLYLSVALLILGAYTKLSVVFVAAPYAITLVAHRGASFFRDRNTYIIAAAAAVAMAPLIYLTLNFGQANVQSVTGLADAAVSRRSLEGWLWYARKLPGQIGWPALVAAIVFVFAKPVLRHRSTGIHTATFLLSWLIVGYVFFSAIDLKEERHSIFLLLPVAMAVGFSASLIFERSPRWAAVSAIAIGLMTLSITLFTRPVHYVRGYEAVVDYVSRHAPQYSNVMFSGYRDGAFIFNMRARSHRPDLRVLRADKMLLQISVRRSLGVGQRTYTEAEIGNLISAMGVHYVVAQPDFWTDLDQMARLQSVLRGAQFEEVTRFPMLANYNAQEKLLIVYRNLGQVNKDPVTITNEIPMLNMNVIEGKPPATN
ncbi:MAG TPA: glycosyltransferase family 39 protein [Burkholderiales bacterium]|nr:glycosyltransferase family 39 protein [Burkholderiales bacterium]